MLRDMSLTNIGEGAYRRVPHSPVHETIELQDVRRSSKGSPAPLLSNSDGFQPINEDDTDSAVLLPAQGREIEVVHGVTEQTMTQFFIQVFPSLMLAGFGVLTAGALLDIVQHWQLFIEVDELLTLVPALLGLKGSLEMTLASRLSTAAHLGELNTPERKWPLITGNLLLVQVQAILVGTAASLFAILLSAMVDHEFSFPHSGLIIAASISAASVASGLLGSVMTAVVVLSRSCDVNPDNVATPIAASLGDLVTLSIFCGFGELLYKTLHSAPWVCVLWMLFVYGVILPTALLRICKNPVYLDILKTKWAWLSLIVAMCISSLAGLILQQFNQRYVGLAALAPIINGVGGNLGAVHASRVSSALHAGSRQSQQRYAVMLFFLVIPLSLIMLAVVRLLGVGHTSMSAVFLMGYLTATMVQVGLLLLMIRKLVMFIWSYQLDPDNIAIPLVTALGDFLGTGTLALCFSLLFKIGDQDEDVGD
eukprot:m.102964 g.102964  ORF g.102964 m.102964 type:complete len:480 (+) comp15705_c0_seq1:118-1557(+)